MYVMYQLNVIRQRQINLKFLKFLSDYRILMEQQPVADVTSSRCVHVPKIRIMKRIRLN